MSKGHVDESFYQVEQLSVSDFSLASLHVAELLKFSGQSDLVSNN